MERFNNCELEAIMPLDGMAVKCLAHELNEICMFSKIQNIYMPKKDQVVFSVYGNNESYNLALSLSPSGPGIYYLQDKMQNPTTPYSFCMFLRKHIGGGHIEKVYALDYERIIYFDITYFDEFNDAERKTLIVELTGRNCNLILVNAQNKIIDALRHVDEAMSSVRRIMPASEYVLPPLQDKSHIENISFNDFLRYSEFPISQALFKTIMGTAPLFAQEVCNRAKVDGLKIVKSLSQNEIDSIMDVLESFKDIIAKDRYTPIAMYEMNREAMKDFYCFDLTLYKDIPSISVQAQKSFLEVFTEYANQKVTTFDLGQKTDILKKIVSSNLKKTGKKLAIYKSSLSDTDKIKQYKLFGELLMANIANLKHRSNTVELLDYYTNQMVTIPLDASKDPLKNAQAYYKKYKKGMAGQNYASNAIKETAKEHEYLQSVLLSLNLCEKKEDAEDIKIELIQQGYLKQKIKQQQKGKKYNKKNESQTATFRPIAYISTEGYEIYAGRNNLENDKLTFGFAKPYDIWLHVKDMHGSHVIIKNNVQSEQFVPDQTLTQAANIAAYHSEAKDSGPVTVDYAFVKNIKKPKGAKPGYVNYFNHFSAYVKTDSKAVLQLRKSK